MLEAYPKQVKLVFKQYPLSFHQNARPAALASLAAGKQGKFWAMHDKIFENFSAMRDANGNLRFTEWARELGLDVAKFEAAMKDPALDAVIQKDLRDGADAQVTGTPATYVNGRKVLNRSLEGYKQMIDEELGKPKTAATGTK